MYQVIFSTGHEDLERWTELKRDVLRTMKIFEKKSHKAATGHKSVLGDVLLVSFVD